MGLFSTVCFLVAVGRPMFRSFKAVMGLFSGHALSFVVGVERPSFKVF